MKNFKYLNDVGKISSLNGKILGKRKPPKCAMCRNHGDIVPTKEHTKCERKLPEHLKNCPECRLTARRRISISKEIKILRRKEATVRNTDNHPQVSTLSPGQRRPQLCRKCGFHGLTNLMLKHKNECPYKTCACEKGCKEVRSRCKAFNSEAKVIRKLKPKLPDQPKELSNGSVQKIYFTSIDEKPLPKFSSTFCTKSQTYSENRVQLNVYSYPDPVKNNYVSDLIEPLKFLNNNQHEQIVDDKADFIDQSQTFLSVSDSTSHVPYYCNPQNYKNKYENLNAMDFDVEIGSVIANFANNIDPCFDETDYFDYYVTQKY